MSSLSSILPPIFNKLIGLYLLGSWPLSLLGFNTRMTLAIFHLFGNCPNFKHWLYIVVIILGNEKNTLWYIPPVMPSGPGAFFWPKLSIVSFISSGVNSTSSSVCMGSSTAFLMVLWFGFSSPPSSLYRWSRISFIGVVYNNVQWSVQWKINKELHYSHISEATYNTYARLLL